MIEYKNDKARETYPNIKEALKDAVYWCSQWAEKRKLPFVITRAIDERIPNVSVSDTHIEGRAVDISVKGWTTDLIDDFIADANKEFAEKIGAYSLTDGKPRFVIFHVGVGPHFHAQIRRGLA